MDPQFNLGENPPPLTEDQQNISLFQSVVEKARAEGFGSGFPNFNTAQYNGAKARGAVLIKEPPATFRDIWVGELGNVAPDNFKELLKAVNKYATEHGFVGGMPTFSYANPGHGIVCGAFLFSPEDAEWRDVSLADVGGNLDDVAARFVATQAYATKNGFVGGFPNMFHADYGRGFVCGTVLLKASVAVWKDLLTPISILK